MKLAECMEGIRPGKGLPPLDIPAGDGALWPALVYRGTDPARFADLPENLP